MYNQVRQLCAAGRSEIIKTYNMKTGRPTKYSDELIQKVDEYMLTTGREATELPTIEGFADFIGVNADSIYEWVKDKDEKDRLKHPEFSEAIKRLKDKQRVQLMNDGMYGGKDVNSTMAIFLLKVNHGMIETEKRILAGDKNDPLTIEIVEQAKE